MPSYQDIETRLCVVEDKIDLVMKSITMTQEVGLVDKKLMRFSLYDLYIASKNAGLSPNAPPVVEIKNAAAV